MIEKDSSEDLGMTRVAVLIPTTGRAAQMKAQVGELLAQGPPEGVALRVFLAIPEDDEETLVTAVRLGTSVEIIRRQPGTTAVEGWNLAFKAAFNEGAEWFVLGADDIKWHKGWLVAALRQAQETGACVVGLNDGGHTDLNEYGPHYMVYWTFVMFEMAGHFIPPDYKSWWFDREICERARRLGVYAPAWEAVAEHLHPDWKTAEMDETYRLGRLSHEADRVVYLQRMALCA